MALVREKKSCLISFDKIMSSLIERHEETKFEVLDSRDSFTDGFCVPMGHCQTQFQLQRYLKDKNLQVKMPVNSKYPDYRFVQL